MGQTETWRTKRNLIAGWLADNFSGDVDVDYLYWPDAADLISFLKANRFEVRPARGAES